MCQTWDFKYDTDKQWLTHTFREGPLNWILAFTFFLMTATSCSFELTLFPSLNDISLPLYKKNHGIKPQPTRHSKQALAFPIHNHPNKGQQNQIPTHNTTCPKLATPNTTISKLPLPKKKTLLDQNVQHSSQLFAQNSITSRRFWRNEALCSPSHAI